MLDDRHVAASQPHERYRPPVQRDERRGFDDESLAGSVELPDREPRRRHPHDDASIDSPLGSRAHGCENEGGAGKHQPEPSHSAIVLDTDQRKMCSV
jgi:hypothetical protein